jgi:hypothetical protein
MIADRDLGKVDGLDVGKGLLCAGGAREKGQEQADKSSHADLIVFDELTSSGPKFTHSSFGMKLKSVPIVPAFLLSLSLSAQPSRMNVFNVRNMGATGIKSDNA